MEVNAQSDSKGIKLRGLTNLHLEQIVKIGTIKTIGLSNPNSVH